MQITPIKMSLFMNNSEKNNVSTQYNGFIVPKLSPLKVDTVNFSGSIFSEAARFDKAVKMKLVPFMDETRPYYTKLSSIKKKITEAAAKDENVAKKLEPIAVKTQEFLAATPYKKTTILASEIYEHSQKLNEIRYSALTNSQMSEFQEKQNSLLTQIRTVDEDIKNFNNVKARVHEFIANVPKEIESIVKNNV